jgi:hypothetical protein
MMAASAKLDITRNEYINRIVEVADDEALSRKHAAAMLAYLEKQVQASGRRNKNAHRTEPAR